MGNVFSWLIQPVSDDEVFPTNQESEEGTAPEQESEGPEVPRPLETLPEDILTSIPVVTKEASRLIVGLVAEASEELQSVALAATEALGIIPYPEVPEQHKPQGLAADLQDTSVFGKEPLKEPDPIPQTVPEPNLNQNPTQNVFQNLNRSQMKYQGLFLNPNSAQIQK
ncbi:unnamed protein product [Boreogadus saida]